MKRDSTLGKVPGIIIRCVFLLAWFVAHVVDGHAQELVSRHVLEASNISAITFSDHGHVLAGSTQGKLFLSTDEGDTWREVGQHLDLKTISSLQYMPNGDVLAHVRLGVWTAGVISSDFYSYIPKYEQPWAVFHNGNDTTLVAKNDTIFVYPDSELSPIGVIPITPRSSYLTVVRFVDSSAHAGRVYLSVADGTCPSCGQIWRSDSSLVHWVPIRAGAENFEGLIAYDMVDLSADTLVIASGEWGVGFLGPNGEAGSYHDVPHIEDLAVADGGSLFGVNSLGLIIEKRPMESWISHGYSRAGGNGIVYFNSALWTYGSHGVAKHSVIGHTGSETVDQRQADAGELSVYPNPTQGAFEVQLSDRLTGEAHVTIFHVDGRVVYDAPLDGGDSGAKARIEHDLPAGVYIIRVASRVGQASATVTVVN